MVKNWKKKRRESRCRIQTSNKPIDHFCGTCFRMNDRHSDQICKSSECHFVRDVFSSDCHQCKQTYAGLCPCKHQLYYKDTKLSSTQLSSSQRAKLTCPRSIYCGKSRISDAGIGVFTSKFLKPETFFGPYIGIRHRSSRQADESAYAWTIEYPNGRIHSYVDACDPFVSNWLRYVNCSYSLAKENLVPIQYNGNIFYKTSRAIQPGEELLIYYGDDYARVLGIEPFDNPARNYQEEKQRMTSELSMMYETMSVRHADKPY